MSTSKKILVVVSLLLFVASFVCWKLTSHEPVVKPVSLEKLMIPSLNLPQGIASGIELRNESSAERWRNVKKSADGKTVVSAEIGYQDNRRGIYTFGENGKIKSYSAYAADDNQRLTYDASFDPASGLIVHSRMLRADGTVESEFHRSPDGVEQTYFYDKNGLNVRTVTIQPDGSQKIATIEDGRTVVDEVTPEVKGVNLGERKLPDGTTVPLFTVKAKGTRILSWDFRDVGGSVRHQGEFLPNGDVQVTVVVSADELKKQDQMLKMQAEAARTGKMPEHPTEVDPDDEDADPPANVVYHPYVRQVWTPYGEDWNRRFYRLKRIEIYSREGRLSQVCVFHDDGVTPQEVQTWTYYEYYNKHFKQQVQLFDKTGKLVTVQQFDQNSGDHPRWENDVSAQNQRGRLPAVILQELQVGSGSRVYRLTGTPFGEEVPAEGYTLPALFCAP